MMILYHKAVVDTGNAEESLYVSDGVSKDNWKYSKHSDDKSHKKMERSLC